MTERVDLSEFLPPYLAEVEELLASANQQLLAVEVAIKQASSNPRAIRELFRGIHTIKGLSAMVDVEPVVVIAHRMEETLRLCDRAGGRLAASAVEPLMAGLRAIEARVRALGAGKPVPAATHELLDALEGLHANVSPAAAHAPRTLLLEPALDAKLSASEREQLTQGAQRGQRACRVDFVPTQERLRANLNINTVRERMSKVAEIVKVLPLSRPAQAGTPGGITFALLVVSSAADVTLAEAADADPAGVQLILDSAEVPAAPAPALDAPAEDGTAGLEEDTTPRRHGLVRVEAARLDDAMERLAALVVNRSRLARAVQQLTAAGAPTRELGQILQENARLLRDLRGSIIRVRMVRVEEVLERLPLMVRGLRRSTGKNVELDLQLGAAEVDKAVGDRLFPAIVHLVRNAVDHAIEPSAERVAKGKPASGLLTIVCRERNSQLEVSIADDGAGVDVAEVARRAGQPVPRGSDELLELLCRPGLSTRDQASETSGRGMGMDIVKRVIVNELGGELSVRTEPGKGTTFTFRVPLTVSIIDAFVLESGAQRYVVPVSAIEELVDVEDIKVTHPPAARGARLGESVGIFERRGEAVSLFQLQSVLQRGEPGAPGSKAILLRHRGELVAFAVDRMLGQQEIVVRPLKDPLVNVPGVAGATDLGDGQPVLVLDLATLGARGRERRSAEVRA